MRLKRAGLVLSCAGLLALGPASARAQGDGLTLGPLSEAVIAGHYYTYVPITFAWSLCPPGGVNGRVLLTVVDKTTAGNHRTTYTGPNWPSLVVWQLPAQYAQPSSEDLTGTIKVDMGIVCRELFAGQNVTSISYFFEGEDTLNPDGDMEPDSATEIVTTTFGSG